MEKVQIIIFLLGIIFVVFVLNKFIFTFYQGRRDKDISREDLFDLTSRKEKNLREILRFMGSKKQIRNDDIEKLLGVSDSTATRYLKDLKSVGKVKQIGELGKFVYYEKI